MRSDYKILQRVNLKLQKWGELKTAQNAQNLDVRRMNEEILRKQKREKEEERVERLSIIHREKTELSIMFVQMRV